MLGIISYTYELLKIYQYFNEWIRDEQKYCKIFMAQMLFYIQCLGNQCNRAIRVRLIVDAALNYQLASNVIKIIENGSKIIIHQ